MRWVHRSKKKKNRVGGAITCFHHLEKYDIVNWDDSPQYIYGKKNVPNHQSGFIWVSYELHMSFAWVSTTFSKVPPLSPRPWLGSPGSPRPCFATAAALGHPPGISGERPPRPNPPNPGGEGGGCPKMGLSENVGYIHVYSQWNSHFS